MRVAVGRLHLDDAFADFEDRHVERAATEVVDDDRFVLLLVEPVGQRRGGRLVDDPQHIQTGDLAGVLGGLPLRIVEVRRHGDDCVGDLLAQVVLRGGLQLLQHHRRDLGRRILLASHVDPRIAVRRLDDRIRHARDLLRHFRVLAAHEALDREHGALRIRDALALGDLANEALTFLGKGNDGGGRARTFLVHDDRRLPTFHDGNDRVGRAQIDSDDLAHLFCFPREQNDRAHMSVCQASNMSVYLSYHARSTVHGPQATVSIVPRD